MGLENYDDRLFCFLISLLIKLNLKPTFKPSFKGVITRNRVDIELIFSTVRLLNSSPFFFRSCSFFIHFNLADNSLEYLE